MIKRGAILLLITVLVLSTINFTAFASGSEDNPLDDILDTETGLEISDGDCKSAILMEAETGTVLFSKNASIPLAPASVTKIMTLLLVAEAIDNGTVSLEQKTYISSNAAGMGGSQVFLEEGEEMSVEELLKCTVIASANDAAVALAELISGNESGFVSRMNERAGELGLKDTVFENCTGLDDAVTKHLTSAYDIAIMSRELIKHHSVMKYTNIWQDSIRGGEFVLTNTNRLVRYYSGCTGLKTGSTDKAGFCVSATAQRDGMHLIAVVMGAQTRDIRNTIARNMLDYGFSNYALFKETDEKLENIEVKKGSVSQAAIYSSGFSTVVKKSDLKKIEKRYSIPESIIAPLNNNSAIGEIKYYINGAEVGSSKIVIHDEINRIGLLDLILELIGRIIVK